MAILLGNPEEGETEHAIRELGERLKNIREAQSLSLEAISRATKIQIRYLLAIENGNLAVLPPGPYVRGFIRQYCEFLSAMDIWNLYDQVTGEQMCKIAAETLDAKQDHITPHKVFKASPSWIIYLVIIISLAAAAGITWNYRGEITGIAINPVDGGTAQTGEVSYDNPEAERGSSIASVDASGTAADGASVDLSWMDGRTAVVPPAVSAKPVEPQTQPAVSAEPPAPAVTPVPAESNVLHISAKADVWLRVSSGGQSLYTGTLKSGESKTFTVSNRAVTARYGNPAGAVVTWKGGVANPVGSGTKPLTKTYRPDGTVADG